MRMRKLRWRSWEGRVAALVLAGVMTLMTSSARAHVADGRLILRWRGPVPEGASFLLSPPGCIPLLARPGEEADSTVLFEDIPSGQARLDLTGPGGRPLLRWNLLVTSELTTQATVDLGTGRLDVSATHPDPFGNTQDWGPSDLAAFPGSGIEGVRQSALPVSPTAAPVILGTPAGPAIRLAPTPYHLDRDAVGFQQPLGNAGAWSAAAAPAIYTDRSGSPLLSLLGGAGNGGNAWGRLRAHLEGDIGALGHSEGEAVFAGTHLGDAGPLGIAGGKLPRNDLNDVEGRARFFSHPAGGILRLHLHVAGSRRHHFLQEFARDTSRDPREDQSALTTSAAWDRSFGPHAVWLEAGYTRNFIEIGDGQAFNALRRYRIGINQNANNDQVTRDGLYWWGGEPTSSVPPHLYNYYTKELAATWSLRAEGRLRPSPRTPLRVGAEATFTTWRWYEHLDPIIDSEPSPLENAGFQYASYLGYSRDAATRVDQGLHAAPRPRTLALFASQRVPLGPGILEAGLRWTRFSPDQGVVRDLANPLGADSSLSAADFLAPAGNDGVDPRAGFFLPLGTAASIWIDGGRTREEPPLEALYVSPNRLQQQAGKARAGTLYLDTARDQIFGMPALKPVLRDRFTAAVQRDLRPGVSLRLTGHLESAHDTWVASRVGAGADSIAYYDNRGRERERGLRLALDAATTSRSRLRFTWDVSRRETDVIEPEPLYRGLLYPDLPLGGTGVQEAAPYTTLWFDRPDVHGWFPSLFDRTHRIAATWTVRIDPTAAGSLFGPLVGRGDFALAVRAASGRPYTPTYPGAAGLMGGSDAAAALFPGQPLDANRNGRLDASEINSERMPWIWQVDLGFQKRFTFVQQEWTLLLDARNVLGQKNPRVVYSASGEVDDDGWLGSNAGRAYLAELGSAATAFRQAYSDRLNDPNRYEEGRTLRVALGLGL